MITKKKTPVKQKPRKNARTKEKDAASYKIHREKAAAKRQEISLLGREIGDIPKVKKPRRRSWGRKSFQRFCEIYFPQIFYLEWSPNHLKVVAKVEQAVLKGGLFAMALPRGDGKSCICETACIWAILYGYHKFVCLIGATAKYATDMLESIQTELETNERLLEDFPEAIYPIHALERITIRSKGQLCGGIPTRIKWTTHEIVLPTIKQSKASGAIIRVAGLDAQIRGMKAKLATGQAIRPTLVLLDDPQTDESARSPSQIFTRMKLLNGAILNLAGPGQKIAGLMPCTVIEQGDMADQILDRDQNPIWQGERTKRVNSFPSNTKLWEQYKELREDSFKNEGDGSEATAFYKKNRKAMDKGASLTWDARFNEDELSALQHAMNLLFRNEASFWSEHQNDPKPPMADIDDDNTLTTEKLAVKCTNAKGGVVPQLANDLSMFIDTQKRLMYWIVVAWERYFTGSIIAYGTFPEQRERFFLGRFVKRTLARVFPKTGREENTYLGLTQLEEVIGREWKREDGEILRIGKCLIDANDPETTEVVYRFCKQSPFASILLPSHGRYFGAASVPMSEYKRKPGDRIGLNWRIPARSSTRRFGRHVIIDTNFWKTLVFERFTTGMGGKGCLSIYGKASQHELLFEHLLAEYITRTKRLTGRSRNVGEWKLRPNKSENHWWDGVVGCAVGASMLGIALPEHDPIQEARRRTVSLAKMQKKEGRRGQPSPTKEVVVQEAAPVGGRRKTVSLAELQKAKRRR
jgi:hypothetical protein